MLIPSRTSQKQAIDPTSNASAAKPVVPQSAHLLSTPVLDQLQQRLKAASQGLGLACLQLRSGLTEDAEETIRKLHEGFQLWRRRLKVEAQAALDQPPAPRRRPTVLVVEDDRNQRELPAGFLRMAGLDVDTAGDGLDALEHLHARSRPDMVLLDMGLPRCDGPTTVREIRRDPSLAGLKIVAVTGYSPDDFGYSESPTGIDRWIHKPIDPQSLLKELDQEFCHHLGCV